MASDLDNVVVYGTAEITSNKFDGFNSYLPLALVSSTE